MDITGAARTRWTTGVVVALSLHAAVDAVWTLRLADLVPADERGLSLVTGAGGAVALAVLAVLATRGRGHGVAGALEVATLASGWQWASRFPAIRTETLLSMVLAVTVLALLAAHGRAAQAAEPPTPRASVGARRS